MITKRVLCQCKVCGIEFLLQNNHLLTEEDANNWEQWAVNQEFTCPDCKHIQKKGNRRVRRYSYKIIPDNNDYRMAVMGNTYAIKDQLKQVGFKWDGSVWYKTFYYIDYESLDEDDLRQFTRYRSCKNDGSNLYQLCQQATIGFRKKIDMVLAQLNEIDEVKEAGLVAQCDSQSDKLLRLLALTENEEEWLRALSQLKEAENVTDKRKCLLYNIIEPAIKEQKRRKNDAEDHEQTIHKPKKPSWMAGHWNGKVYGEQQKIIYLDSEKLLLTDEQSLELADYLNCLTDWKEESS